MHKKGESQWGMRKHLDFIETVRYAKTMISNRFDSGQVCSARQPACPNEFRKDVEVSAMKKDPVSTAQAILEAFGGKEKGVSAARCAARLRVRLTDASLVD